ncbi:MAG: TIM barrel protein [Bryobacteraceae bacterium]
MKFGLVVSTVDALPSAFVVLRDDLCRCVDRCAELGFDGVELALRHPAQVDLPRLRQRLAATGLEIPCLSSGQVFAADRLYFTSPDSSVRAAAVERIVEMVRLAAELGARVNLGRVRGGIAEGEPLEGAKTRFFECLHRCADVAEPLNVTLLIEPVNRYETNFINTCAAAADVIREAGRSCLKLMPDLFHMNIEDASFRAAFESFQEEIDYVNVADSNRWAPGWGHTPFDEIFRILSDIGYDGYLTGEVLPEPDPDSAARQVVDFLSRELGRDRTSFA